ncbi:hypothetical protein C5E10_18055 [Pseudoclavibacter sp. RFBG4]|uniref:hypothetical protein n=1 Tax=Pseudoclavibacter sp. RFBG4 TaxID=2080575 RepID=UPI000CE79A46|nr:hypothetical protein [Pseudoclavibacter sp. RFBG4]PPG25974.1 hypothetical protein C5E10_18055 [Pseudoclavibacter sp. RFBG4]
MPSSFAKTTITRKRYPVLDDMGTPRTDYDATPEVESIEGCWVEPVESTSDNDGQILTVTGYKIAAPFGTDILARDIITVDGFPGDYIAEGDAQQVRSPTGRLNQALASVRRHKRG